MNLDYVFPHIDLPNEELTSEAQKNEVLATYKTWLIANGCIFPSVIPNQLEFPVAFGEYGVIGTRALEDLPSLKAFLFVPLEIIICPQKAKNSEISEVLTSNPKLFKSHSRWADYILWVFILYEKLKGPASFFHPYFAAIGESEMLMDWTMSEKMELQDKFLVFESKKQEKTALFYYESLVDVFKAFPQFFPDDDLQKNFLWAYKLVTTRSFSHGEGMVIPLADNLNHEDVYVDYLTLSAEFLNRKSADETELTKDYRDFKGFAFRFDGKQKFRTHRNRLEKLVERMPDADFGFLKHVWQVDELLSGFESSSDEEEFVDESEEEESGEEGEEEEEEEEESSVEEPVNTNIEGKYFVMRTGAEGSYLKGSQVFNCYGRLNNTDLLNEYGFCLLPNRYDSLYVRMIKSKSNNGIIEVPKVDFSSGARLKDMIKIYFLKYYKLNEKFLEYFRRILTQKPNDRFLLTEELKVITQASQVLLQVESCYPTTLEEDEEVIKQVGKLPIRRFFALRKAYLGYRISQKRILKSHIEMLNTLRDIFFSLMLGKSLEEAHLSDKSLEGIRKVYPLRKYLQNIRLVKVKSDD